MKREFKQTDRGRMVKSAVYKLHCYHLECAPEGAEEQFIRTEKTNCHKCNKPLRQK